jgi:exopolysaccharide biosynthesis protein
MDTNRNSIAAHKHRVIAHVADQSIEVSIFDGRPQVKKGASISSILGPVSDSKS